MIVNPALSELNFIEGEVLLFDKPFRWTSFDLVRKIRAKIKRHLGKSKIKVGHAGTLDPLATGLMIICTGKKTKEIEKFQATKKEYIANIYLGATTPSFDLETKVDQTYSIEHITEELVENTLKNFIGKQEQIPPVYSAKRVDGQRAYKKARKGVSVEMKPSVIEIYHIDLLDFILPEICIKISCSKGTYIRSLANDIGTALNSGAYLSKLRRTKIGDFNIEEAMKVEDFILEEQETQIP
jgi:tRNA pseudouridine55 synthase